MLGQLCDAYGWPPDFWRSTSARPGMGWRELQGWIAELRRKHDRERRRVITDPESWEGRENDGWWDEQHAKHRGR